jgi:hypothetical protein
MPTRLIVTYGSTDPAPAEWNEFRCSNTLYYQDVETDVEAIQLAQSVANIYAALPSPFVIGNVEVRPYLFNGVTPSGPAIEVLTAAQAASALRVGPREVALCLSYFAGVNRPRSRGRIYTGPFRAQNDGEYATETLLGEVLNFGSALWNANGGSGTWSVYSPTVQAFAAITNLWCDNAWDTVRSRGLPSTNRVERVPVVGA